SIIAGIVITLLTGFISNTKATLVGATHYGYPLAWLIRRVLAPQYFPWRIEIVNLIIDIVTWTLVIGIILYAIKKSK
ncbi:hypothetical protein, partial [[Eubacterium] cellulosolvens]